ncbi:MAG: hypothetical protein ACRDMY_10685 [Gaiellaceae bacterium]
MLLPDGTLVLRLYRFVVHHHGRIGDPSSPPYGNGVALWFEIDNFDDAVQRAERFTPRRCYRRTVNPRRAKASRPSRVLAA